MLKVVKIILLVIAILLVISLIISGSFLVRVIYFPVIYPIKSTPQELSLVHYSGFHSNRPVITLKHFVDERHITDYVLTIEKGLRQDEPQTYELPRIEEGTVEVYIELGRRFEDSSFTITYNQASDLYEKGLLIYLYTDFSNAFQPDGYIYFRSGRTKICYFRGAASSEWSIISNGPKLKRIPKRETINIYWYSGWKENEWVVIQREE